MPPAARTLDDLGVETIKQYPGLQTVPTGQRRVRVKAPGKFFLGLSPSEQKDCKERHFFSRHM